MKEFGIALTGGFTAALIGVAAQYFIAYKLIEEPKIEIEKRKVAIEAQKQSASLIPIFSNECSATAIDAWTWRLQCSNKSSGQYSAWVSISGVDLVPSANREAVVYSEQSGFTISFPEDKKQYVAFPSSSGYLDLYVNLDRKRIPNGIARNDLVARVAFKYSTTDSAKKPYTSAFPEMQEAVEEMTTRYVRVYTPLPPTVSSAQQTSQGQ
jgi:hypothetical protein